MTTTGIEIIDLTDSKPQSPVASNSQPVRSLRKEKRPPSSSNSPIVISDDETPSTPVSSEPTRKQKARRRRKKKAPRAENAELVATRDIDEDNGHGESRIEEQNDPVLLPVDGDGQSGSHEVLFYLDDKPGAVRHENSDPDATSAPGENSLLLPEHVMVDTPQLNGVLNEVEATGPAESDTEDFIHYADEELNVCTIFVCLSSGT